MVLEREWNRRGHECVGFCEFDKYAYMSYVSMHLLTDEQRIYIYNLPKLKDRQKEIMKPEYLNGEWYAKDIKEVKAEEVPKADCWCFGSPCQTSLRWSGGYDIEWQNINSKWFVPQNRERIYTIGHLRRCGRRKILPIAGTDGQNNLEIDGLLPYSNGHVSQRSPLYDVTGISTTELATQYKDPIKVVIRCKK